MKTRWRLIIDPPMPPAFNMAADQVLLNQQTADSLPVFRIYFWNQPTLSIGKNQKIHSSLNWDWCAQHNVAVIRRVTGGQAVLHGQDITYSVIGSVKDPMLGGGILQTYRTISQGLFNFFQSLGLSLEIQPHSTRDLARSAVCFEMPSAFELLINGKKIVGSAQRQTTTAFLQHGTIPLNSQIEPLSHLFLKADPNKLSQEITSLESENVLHGATTELLCDKLCDSFQTVFGMDWDRSGWTEQELEQIQAEISNFPLSSP
ncbi:MAG: lipoate--protein ligase family protein [SAR324 cluster bacterium]|nr:lipoate--protein ligase family protein [SAR324 cluster bacterium]